DVSKPDAPALIAGPQVTAGLPATALAANGSGLGALVRTRLGSDRRPQLLALCDPIKTTAFLTRFSLPPPLDGVASASGIASGADSIAGLVVVNYAPFDPKGVPPVVSVNAAALDNDPNTPGIQVTEGSFLAVPLTVTDDVQVRNVELLLNGQ